MNNRMFYDNATGTNWKRISKAQARKEYNNGKNICICAVNMHPFTHWRLGYIVNNTGVCDIDNTFETFDKLVNNYEWYNCTLSETGKYSAFYMEVE